MARIIIHSQKSLVILTILLVIVGTIYIKMLDDRSSTSNEGENTSTSQESSDQQSTTDAPEQTPPGKTSPGDTGISDSITDQSKEHEVQPTILTPIDTEKRPTPAGDITSVELHDLNSDTTYLTDLSEYEFSSLALSWTEGDFLYALGETDKTKLQPLAISDDIQDFEVLLSSNLLELIADAPKTLLLQPKQHTDYVKIDLISPSPKTVDTSPDRSLAISGVYNKDSGAKYTEQKTISRDEWGANPSGWDQYSSYDIDDSRRFTWQPYYHPVSRIVVHHTATQSNPYDAPATVRSIYLYHTYTRGWGDIGYNFLIDHWGNVYEGKAGGDEVYGYHARTEANAMSIGISMIGTFSTESPTNAAQDTLIRLMAEKGAFYGFNLQYSSGTLGEWLNLNYTVFGHRGTYYWSSGWHQNITACPGDRLNWLLTNYITPRAQEYKGQDFATLRNVVSQVHQSAQNPHFDDVITVKFKLPTSASEVQVLALIPDYSGISSVSVEQNIAEITVLDWDNGGTVVPPPGWSGWNAAGTFFPPASGSDDRLKALLKIFRMDPNVEYAEFIPKRELF